MATRRFAPWFSGQVCGCIVTFRPMNCMHLLLNVLQQVALNLLKIGQFKKRKVLWWHSLFKIPQMVVGSWVMKLQFYLPVLLFLCFRVCDSQRRTSPIHHVPQTGRLQVHPGRLQVHRRSGADRERRHGLHSRHYGGYIIILFQSMILEAIISPIKTRMHSSRIRTVRSSGRLSRGRGV